MNKCCCTLWIYVSTRTPTRKHATHAPTYPCAYMHTDAQDTMSIKCMHVRIEVDMSAVCLTVHCRYNVCAASPETPSPGTPMGY